MTNPHRCNDNAGYTSVHRQQFPLHFHDRLFHSPSEYRQADKSHYPRPLWHIAEIFCPLLYPFQYIIHTLHPVREYSRSEEHTSELQSRGQFVCRLLLEKKKKTPARGPTQRCEEGAQWRRRCRTRWTARRRGASANSTTWPTTATRTSAGSSSTGAPAGS